MVLSIQTSKQRETEKGGKRGKRLKSDRRKNKEEEEDR